MTNQAILEKAITKAIENGWLDDGYTPATLAENALSGEGYGFIYHHDFAKALWGDAKYRSLDETVARSNSLLEFNHLAGWLEHHMRITRVVYLRCCLGDTLL